jgi:hypothetical protein
MIAQWPILSFLWLGEEKRYVRRECKKALQTYHDLRAQHSAIKGLALYEQVVVRLTGASADAAKALVRAAECTFAEWPVERDLIFRDVVHYLCFKQFCQSHGDRGWMRTSLRQVVDAEIPRNL